MKAKRTIITVMFAVSMVLSSGFQAWSFEEDSTLDIMPDFGDLGLEAEPLDRNSEGDMVEDRPSRFSLALKGVYHTFWSQGLLAHGQEHGLPGLSAMDLSGPGLEFDFDFDGPSYLVFSATVGAYQGVSTENDIDLYTIYGLGTLKLVNQTQYVDYYTGVGLGVYYCNMEASDKVDSLKPGVHLLVGLRIPLSPNWSILLEDRLAFSQKAKGGFKDMNFGGNFGLLGCSYRF